MADLAPLHLYAHPASPSVVSTLTRTCRPLTKAANLASYATGSNDDLEAYLRECEQEAERLVKNHWSAIEALAFALLAKGTLTGDEARAIIDSSLVKLADELEG